MTTTMTTTTITVETSQTKLSKHEPTDYNDIEKKNGKENSSATILCTDAMNMY